MTYREPPVDQPRRSRPLPRGSAAAALALALIGPAPAAAATAEETATPEQDTQSSSTEDLVDLDILSINDFHGRLEADGDVAGASRLACTVDARRAENPNTLFVSAGDNVGASTFTSFIQDDQPTIEALNAMDLDVSALGNHEFDGGSADVDDRLLPESDFPLLGANIVDASSGEPLYEPYAVEEVDGVDVGFIGVITEDMPNLVSPAGVEGIRWADMSETVNHYAEELTSEEKADVIVVLAHDGAPGTDLASADGAPYGKLVDEAPASVDAIISGHTHQEYALQNANGTWVTQTGQYSEGLGSLELTYDRAAGEVVESRAEVVDLVDDAAPDADACTDAEVQGVVDDAMAHADEAGAAVVGEVTGELPLDRAQNADGSENRAASSPLGSFVADAQVWAARQTTPDVDFGVMNPGGLRADVGSGEITYEELATSQPFANTLAVVDLTGEQVRRLLEQQWREDSTITLAQSAELRYTYDPTAPIGERLGHVVVDGEPLDADTTYQVMANSFLASGGDGFSVFTEAPSSDTGMTDLTGIVDYVEEHTPVAPDSALRSTAVTWQSDPGAVHGPGDEISLTVGGLAHSTAAAPVGEEVSVSLGGADRGTVPLDTSFVDQTDERGRAEITVEVPEHLDGGEAPEVSAGLSTALASTTDDAAPKAGEVPLIIEEPVTGTRLELPVTASGEVLAAADGETPSETPDGSSETGSGSPEDDEPSDQDESAQQPTEQPTEQQDAGQEADAPAGSDAQDESSDRGETTEPVADDGSDEDLADTGTSGAALLMAAVVVALGGGTALTLLTRRRAVR